MMPNSKIKGGRLFAVLLGMAISPGAWATATANSDIDFTNLQIIPAVGTVQLLDNWSVESYAEAQNSLGGYDAHYQSSYPGGSAAADALVPMAAGHGAANSPSPPPFPPDLSVTGHASSLTDVPGAGASAQSSGRGTLSNTLVVTGGTGTAAINFAAGISGLLHVFTDSLGLLAETEVIFSMEIFGLPDTGAGPQNSLVLFSDRHLTIGSNTLIDQSFAETLAGSAQLGFDTPYGFLIQVDSESRAVAVDEPPMPALLLAGVAFLLKRRRSQYSEGRW